jgi:hypothetical protein
MKMRDLMKSSNQPLPPRSENGSESDEQECRTKDSSMEPEVRRASTRTTSMLAHHPPAAPAEMERPSPIRIYEPRDPLRHDESDIVERHVIDPEAAQSLLDTWRNCLTYACPGIIINIDWTAAQLRQKKPLLFHAVMAAASHSQGSALSDILEEEAVYLIARSAFINGFKSVECVQALLVLVAYYSPPKTVGQIQIYSWVCCAPLTWGITWMNLSTPLNSTSAQRLTNSSPGEHGSFDGSGARTSLQTSYTRTTSKTSREIAPAHIIPRRASRTLPDGSVPLRSVRSILDETQATQHPAIQQLDGGVRRHTREVEVTGRQADSGLAEASEDC